MRQETKTPFSVFMATSPRFVSSICSIAVDSAAAADVCCMLLLAGIDGTQSIAAKSSALVFFIHFH